MKIKLSELYEGACDEDEDLLLVKEIEWLTLVRIAEAALAWVKDSREHDSSCPGCGWSWWEAEEDETHDIIAGPCGIGEIEAALADVEA